MQLQEGRQAMMCQVDQCERERGRHGARGMCKMHYERWLKHGDPRGDQPLRRHATATTCSIEGCDNPRYQKSLLCSTHKMRKHRHGDPLISKDRRGIVYVASNGYRKRMVKDHPLAEKGGQVYEHRLVLYEAIGPEPQRCHWCATTVEWNSTLHVDHLDGDKTNNTPTNLVASCGRCNRARGRWWPDLAPAHASQG